MAYLSHKYFWWEESPEDLAKCLFTHVEAIEKNQAHVHEANLWHATLYSNRNEIGLNWKSGGRTFNHDRHGVLVTENVVKSVIDTAASIIAKNKPRVRVLTSGSEWRDQRKAKKLEKVVMGEFRARGMYDLGPDVFRDAGIFGTGVTKTFNLFGKPYIERVLIDEIVVDEEACATTPPMEMFQVKLIDKFVLKALYPDATDAIDEACKKREWADYREIPDTQVVVIEAWRLPAKPGDSGVHAIVVETGVLLHEPWKSPTFPFNFYYWSKPLTGFYGQGLAEDLVGFQIRINQLNRFIQRCQDLVAVPRVFVDVSSKLLKIQLDDTIGAIIPYRGKPPTFLTPQAVGAEIYNYKEQLKASAFQFAGISQLSAQSLKPAGLESAVALREFNDIENQRFAIQAQRYEQWHLDVARQLIGVCKVCYGGRAKAKQKFSDLKTIHQIDWSQVDMEADRYELSIEPASILSLSPAARLQAVTELAQVGQLDKSEIRYLLNHPDLEHSDSVAYADFEDIERVIQTLLDGDYETPEPFQNLEMGIRRVQMACLKAKSQGCPEDILESFRTWVSQAKRLLEMAVPAGVQPATMNPPPEEMGMGAVEQPPIGMPEGDLPAQMGPGMPPPMPM